jgi:CBS domain-containing protein
MEPRTEHTGHCAADRREGGREGIRAVATGWSGSALGGVGRVEQGAEACVSGLRTINEAARPVGDLPLGAAPVLPAHLTMAAGRKVAELKKATLVLVERDGRLVGVVDQTALLSAADGEQLGDAMKRLDVCLAPTTPLARARELFARTGAAALPVAAGSFLLGVVERTAVERALPEVEWREVGTARAAAPRVRANDVSADTLVPRRNAA